MLKQHLRMAVFVVLLVLSIALAILTYSSHDHAHPLMQFLSSQHIIIMLALVFVSIGFGYVWAYTLQEQLRAQERESDQLFDVLQELLSAEEHTVIAAAVEQGGRVLQSVIARKPGMTRVKAHRTVKSLEERGVLRTEREGKQVVILLKRSLLERFQSEKKKT